jgi:hypothetical protein
MPVKRLGFLFAAVLVTVPTAARTHGSHAYVIVTIKATSGWQRVPLRLGGHGVLHFAAQGQWVFNPSQPAVDADGAASLPTLGRTSYAFSGVGGQEGQLVGRIGKSGAPFVAGPHGFHQVARGERGPLFLIINDDHLKGAGVGLSDNSGTLRVRIEYER